MSGEVISINQKRAAQNLANALKSNEDLEGKDILANSGYSKSIQKNPKVVFSSKGFKLALKELGFSVEAADLTIAKILRTGKEENQIKASQEIYKRLGAYEQTEGGKTLIINISSEVAEKYNLPVKNDSNSKPSDNSERPTQV